MQVKTPGIDNNLIKLFLIHASMSPTNGQSIGFSTLTDNVHGHDKILKHLSCLLPVICNDIVALRTIPSGFQVQILVDISTPAHVFEKVDAAVTVLFAANPLEYTGEKLVCANGATDPLKYTLCVFWEYKQPGKPQISWICKNCYQWQEHVLIQYPAPK